MAQGPSPAEVTKRPFPTLNPAHIQMARLLANTMEYFHPRNGIIDPVSGYPRDGWNHDPDQGLYLRDFTQLTAIGIWLEVLASCAVGDINDAYWTPDRALEALSKAADSLAKDQQDPAVADRGLLGNFLGLTPDGRIGPMASEVYQRDLAVRFGDETAGKIWRALEQRGWIHAMRDGRMAVVRRPPGYGLGGFTGPLAPYANEDTRAAILAVLDRRVVQVVFGDNANLSASAAKVIGALSSSELREDRRAMHITETLEAFLDGQRDGFLNLYDPGMRMFRFGWNATLGHYLGWPNDQRDWQIAYSDYLVNEFRGPTAYVIVRYGLPVDGLANLGFQTRAAPDAAGQLLHTLAPYDGSAFQSFGLSLFMGERRSPSWRLLLDRAAGLHLAFARRHHLPSLLSESYSGNGTEYTARCGVPDLAVASEGRITDAPSLYTLGVAYALRPAEVEAHLAEHATTLKELYTDHGPWEGFHMGRREPIRFQTTAHTGALLLGALDRDERYMEAYLEAQGLMGAERALMPVGSALDLLGPQARVICWSPHGQDVRGRFEGSSYRVRGTKAGPAHLTFSYPARTNGINMAGMELQLRYRLQGPLRAVSLQLDRKTGIQRLFATELRFRLEETAGQPATIRIPLPATPGLTDVRELVLRIADAGAGLIDFRLESMRIEPL